MKTLGEIFPSLLENSGLSDLVLRGEVLKVHIANEARSVTLWVKFDGLVERKVLFDMEFKCAKALNISLVRIIPKFSPELFNEKYFSQIYLAIKRDIPSINGTLDNAEVLYKNNELTINLLNGGKSVLDAKGFDKALINKLAEEFGLNVKINYSGVFSVSEGSEEYQSVIKNAEEQIQRENNLKAAQFFREEEENSN